jgi:hypothetical protein
MLKVLLVSLEDNETVLGTITADGTEVSATGTGTSFLPVVPDEEMLRRRIGHGNQDYVMVESEDGGGGEPYDEQSR